MRDQNTLTNTAPDKPSIRIGRIILLEILLGFASVAIFVVISTAYYAVRIFIERGVATHLLDGVVATAIVMGVFSAPFIFPLVFVLFPLLVVASMKAHRLRILMGFIGGSLAGTFVVLGIEDGGTNLGIGLAVVVVASGGLSGLIAGRLVPWAANHSLQGRRP